MASLNTLRTKFGYVLSAIIAFALLAFIFSLKNEMGFSSNDVKVGEINSEDVLYTEYYAEYQNIKNQYGANESTEEEAAALANAAWQSMISKKMLVPGFEQVGLSMSEAERMAVINGEVPTQSFSSAFADPATGVFNPAYVAQFLGQSSVNPEVEAVWNQINTQAREERAAMKYTALVRSGAYANKLEVAQGVASSNNSYSGKWVSIPYTSMPDSLFTVSDAEIKKYYEANKASFRTTPSRGLSYVTFSFEPTAEDIVTLENTALNASKEFAVAESVSDYIRSNVYGEIATTYVSEAQLAPAQAEAFSKGEMYGPVNTSNTWTMSRVASTVMAPDSVGIRHIVLNYAQEALADSLVTALKGGASFAQAAQEHSLYTQTAQVGGEVGVLPFSSFSDEFVSVLATAKSGDVVKIAAGDMIQVLQVYRADSHKPQYKVATVVYPIEASQATISSLHSDAGLYSVDAKGSVDKFKSAADERSLVVRTASFSNGDRTIRTINDSREIIRWAYGAEVGQMSDIFKTDDGYVVAMLTSISNDEYRPLASASSTIRTILMRDKKFAEASKKMTGSSIEAVAASIDGEVSEFADVKFASQYIAGLGVEPKVVGAITLGEGGLTAPVQGLSGVYVLDVDPATTTEAQTEAMQSALAQATAEDRVSQYIFNVLQEMANIKDLRGEFF